VTSLVRALFLAVTPAGAVLTGLLTQLYGDDPRPVFAGAGGVILVAVPVAWLTTLRRYRRAAALSRRRRPSAWPAVPLLTRWRSCSRPR